MAVCTYVNEISGTKGTVRVMTIMIKKPFKFVNTILFRATKLNVVRLTYEIVKKTYSRLFISEGATFGQFLIMTLCTTVLLFFVNCKTFLRVNTSVTII